VAISQISTTRRTDGAFVFSYQVAVPGATGSPLAVVYKGPAGDGGSAGAMLKSFGYDVVYFPGTDANGKDLVLKNLLGSAKLYLQPGGGDVYMQGRNAVANYTTDIQNFVNNGGRYVGICMGAYLADNSLPDYPGYDILGKYVDTMNYITQPNAEVKDSKDYTIMVNWGPTGAAQRKVYFQNGPSFVLKSACASDPACAAKVKPLGFYRNGNTAGTANGDMASVMLPYGNGTVVLLGPHPEIQVEDNVVLWSGPYPSTADMFKDVVTTPRSSRRGDDSQGVNLDDESDELARLTLDSLADDSQLMEDLLALDDDLIVDDMDSQTDADTGRRSTSATVSKVVQMSVVKPPNGSPAAYTNGMSAFSPVAQGISTKAAKATANKTGTGPVTLQVSTVTQNVGFSTNFDPTNQTDPNRKAAFCAYGIATSMGSCSGGVWVANTGIRLTMSQGRRATNAAMRATITVCVTNCAGVVAATASALATATAATQSSNLSALISSTYAAQAASIPGVTQTTCTAVAVSPVVTTVTITTNPGVSSRITASLWILLLSFFGAYLLC